MERCLPADGITRVDMRHAPRAVCPMNRVRLAAARRLLADKSFAPGFSLLFPLRFLRFFAAIPSAR